MSAARGQAVIDLTEEPGATSRRKRARTAGDAVVVVDDSPPKAAGTARAAAMATSRGARAPPAPVPDELPPWHAARGTKEYTALARSVASGEAPCHGLELPDERDVCLWRLKLAGFDPDVPGGRALNADLARLGRECGQDYLQCEIRFPPDYPARPFMLRLVSPRCEWYTGHVTAGGSVCMEALAQTGSAHGWRPEYCVSGLLPLVKNNLIHVEAVVVRTASGPGGVAGPLRVDFGRRWHPCGVTTPYSAQEAQAAFARAEAHHRANGW